MWGAVQRTWVVIDLREGMGLEGVGEDIVEYRVGLVVPGSIFMLVKHEMTQGRLLVGFHYQEPGY